MPAMHALGEATESSSIQVSHMINGVRSLTTRLLSRSSLPATTSHGASSLHARQQGTVAIPTVYYGLDSGPSPGTVVGATLGAVAGFLVLVWLFSTLNGRRNATVVDEEIVRERSPRRRRSRRSEMRSVSRGSRPERVIRQERIVRDSSRAPPSMPRSTFIVDERTVPGERRVPGDDVVEVMEEEGSSVGPPRRPSRRGGSGYR